MQWLLHVNIPFYTVSFVSFTSSATITLEVQKGTRPIWPAIIKNWRDGRTTTSSSHGSWRAPVWA